MFNELPDFGLAFFNLVLIVLSIGFFLYAVEFTLDVIYWIKRSVSGWVFNARNKWRCRKSN